MRSKLAVGGSELAGHLPHNNDTGRGSAIDRVSFAGSYRRPASRSSAIEGRSVQSRKGREI